MKKALAIILAALFVCAMPLPALAAGPVELRLANVQAAPGDSVDIVLSVKNNPGINTINVLVEYDSARLELVSAAAILDGGTLFCDTIATDSGFWFEYPENTSFDADCDVASLRFKVKDGASGTTAVTLSHTDWDTVSDKDGNMLDYSVTSATVTIAESVHTHSWSEWTRTKAPACTAAGEETRTCPGCGETETREVAALGHAWTEWTQTKAPAYTMPGEEYRECSRCHEWETREVPVLTGTPLDAVKILQGAVGLGPDTGYTPADAAAILARQ